ncbi:MAG: TldD/PmbA family protein [Pseudomonadota bacterium]
MSPEDLSRALLDAARRAGADEADALTVSSRDVSVSVREGALEEAEGAESLDFGLRVLVGRSQASVSASDPDAVEELAMRAVAMARAAPEDPYAGLAPQDRLADLSASPDLELYDDAAPPSPDALQAAALEAEAAAMAVTGVAQVESASASARVSSMAFATSHGFAGAYERTNRSFAVSAVAGEGLGMETDYDFASRIWGEDLPAPAEIGARAGVRAAERLNPRKAKTGAYPVLFDQRVASSLVGHVLAAINGGSVARGSSWLKDAMGQAVLPAGFTITDDPHRKRGAGSRPFDGEGMAMSPRALIDDGVLAGWILDTATARQLDLTAPGGARRGVGAPPSPGVSNLALTEGDRSREDLIADMGEGLIVTSLIGASISATTGAYSRGASGFWVEGGEIAYPVNELTIAGSLPNFMKRLVAANDADRTKSLIVPSLLVEGLTVASG